MLCGQNLTVCYSDNRRNKKLAAYSILRTTRRPFRVKIPNGDNPVHEANTSEEHSQKKDDQHRKRKKPDK